MLESRLGHPLRQQEGRGLEGYAARDFLGADSTFEGGIEGYGQLPPPGHRHSRNLLTGETSQSAAPFSSAIQAYFAGGFCIGR